MNVIDEGLQNKARYETAPTLTKEYLDKAIEKILKKIDMNLERFTYKFPSSSSIDLKYQDIDNVEWTTSFWTGMLWLAYEYTKDEKYRHVAELHLESFKERLDRKGPDIQHHDVGFIFTLSSVAAYKLTGNPAARAMSIEAADFLITRYHEKAGIIQAWGDLSDPAQRGRIIIDCNMNLPLLYWASEETGDPKYREMAYTHVQNAAKYIVRDDASTYHTYYLDVETGAPKYGNTHQGYSDESCWSRGQAWGVYGFPLTHKYVHDNELMGLSKKVTNYFLNRLPEDDVCYWDLIFTEGNEQERDSSAASIAVCGLLEMVKSLPLTDPLRKYYENASLKIVKSLTDNYLSDNPEEDGLLLHGVYAKNPGNRGVDEFCIWGDYYYFEALMRLSKDWELYW